MLDDPAIQIQIQKLILNSRVYEALELDFMVREKTNSLAYYDISNRNVVVVSSV